MISPKLSQIIKYAYHHTTFYRNLYDSHSIDISQITSLEQLPIVTPQNLLDSPFEFKSDESVYKVSMTSGTQSRPKVVFRTISDFEESVQNECLFLNWAGVTQSDSVCIIQPFGINGYGEITLEACKRLGIFAIPIGDLSNSEVISAINYFSPSVLDITPSKLFSLLQSHNIHIDKLRLAMVAGESIHPAFRFEIQNRYGIEIVNQYGSTEFDCIAAEKVGTQGLQILLNDFIFEIIDNNLIITSLYHKGTPLIRYQIGDKAILNGDYITILGRDSSLSLHDGIILESSQINDVVIRNGGLFWQCLVYIEQRTLCVDLRVICNSSTDIESIYKEIKFSLDFIDLIETGEIQFNCTKVDRLIGDGRKQKHFVDARSCTDDLRIALICSHCFEAFYFSLPPVTDRYIRSFICKISDISIQILLELSIYIIHFWTTKARKLGKEILALCYKSNLKVTLSNLSDLAISDNWEIREEAAKVISCLLLAEFQSILPWIKENCLNKNENIRRAILVGIKFAAEYSTNESDRSQLLDFMDNYLFDTSQYVAKSFASFTIGDGFLNVCPKLVELKLDSWLLMNDCHVNCIIIRVFKSSGGVNNWPLAKKYLTIFSQSSDPKTIQALTATKNYLRKHNIKEI